MANKLLNLVLHMFVKYTMPWIGQMLLRGSYCSGVLFIDHNFYIGNNPLLGTQCVLPNKLFIAHLCNGI